MALSNEDRDRVRQHLGYPSIGQATVYMQGFPAALEPFFFLEGNMNTILPVAEKRVRKLLDSLDALLEQLLGDADALVAKEVGDIVLRDDEFEKVVQRYMFTRGELSNALASPANPYDQRFGMGSGMGINVGVTG